MFIAGSEATVDRDSMRLPAPILTALLGAVLLEAHPLRAQDAPLRSDCLSTSEIRDTMASRKILEPMTAVRNAVRLTHSEPLRSQLCRTKDGLQYELTLLRRDGKVVRVVLNAVSGAVISNRTPPERQRLERPKQAPTVHAKSPAPDRVTTEAADHAREDGIERDKADRPDAPGPRRSQPGPLGPSPVVDGGGPSSVRSTSSAPAALH